MSLSPASQVLIRNSEFFSEGRWVLANPVDGFIFNELSNPNCVGFHQYFDVYQQCLQVAPNHKHHFTHVLVSEGELFDGAVIYMPKAKEQAKMLIANMAACVKPGGLIFLVGENKSGIKGADKLFGAFAQVVNKVDSARHCSLFCAQLNDQTHSFQEQDWLIKKDLKVGDQNISWISFPGVFSANELDAGTKLLLENLPPQVKGKVLDFACGSGIIGCYIARHFGLKDVTLSDINALALHAAQLNAQALNIEVKIVPSDGLAQLKSKFDFVFTNPPFHTGIKTDYSVTDGFIRQLKGNLNPTGRLILVANRFLPYPDMLDKYIGRNRLIAQTSKFNLYQCG